MFAAQVLLEIIQAHGTAGFNVIESFLNCRDGLQALKKVEQHLKGTVVFNFDLDPFIDSQTYWPLALTPLFDEGIEA